MDEKETLYLPIMTGKDLTWVILFRSPSRFVRVCFVDLFPCHRTGTSKAFPTLIFAIVKKKRSLAAVIDVISLRFVSFFFSGDLIAVNSPVRLAYKQRQVFSCIIDASRVLHDANYARRVIERSIFFSRSVSRLRPLLSSFQCWYTHVRYVGTLIT